MEIKIEVNLHVLDIVGVLSPKSKFLYALTGKEGNDPIFENKVLKYIL